ncbi:Copper radical oxidase [Mycena sanguinolenta]|uniref:Copper radical oxidase n=1 Tax=Mycena sanguinolenta TaxID=230812 RepID=A0A8H7D4I4_9AGAR|nr:Copper radical oxidase [Mycena sanguinolenta]
MFYYRLLPFALTFPGVVLAAQVPDQNASIARAPAGWKDLGCFAWVQFYFSRREALRRACDASDNTLKRILAGSTHTANNMTIEACISYCNMDGFSYAGLEYARECYCDNANHAPSPAGPVTDCNMSCAGNPTESCGAGLRMRVYNKLDTPQPATPSKGKWESIGCYKDAAAPNRVLPQLATVKGNMTVEICTSACQASNYTYAGLEYSSGRMLYAPYGAATHVLAHQRTIAAATWPAPPAIPSKPSSNGKWETIGCYKDAAAPNRTLPQQAALNLNGNMTIESCTIACQAGNYSYAGLEYASECWCGNTRPSTPADNTSCNMACSGNKTETCGGNYALNVFQTQSGVATICKETTTDFDVQLTAVKKADGSQSLLVIAKTEKNELILTDCSNCSTPYDSQILIHGELLAVHAENTTAAAIANTTAVVSSSVNKGDTVVFKHTFSKSSTKFCTVSNPDDDGETDLLGVNGQHDQWAICPTKGLTGGPGNVVVWAPTLANPNYVHDECESIFIVAQYCEEGDDDEDDEEAD